MPWQRTHTTGKGCSNRERQHVGRRFAARLHSIYVALVAAIEGIEEPGDPDHLASRLLHRLLFLYFLQQRGLLAHDPCYLQRRLHLARQNPAETHSFYRDVLHPLFTATGPGAHVPVPLASLFIEPVHDPRTPLITIPDTIFVQLFAFFDEYSWSLEDRPLLEHSLVTPEVLNMLFGCENKHKDLGAYYTPTDVTTYITRNTLLPVLFTRTDCQQSRAYAHRIWSRFTQQPERYLFAAARKGEKLSLPPEVVPGLCDVAQRQLWQEIAAEPYALPGETWREVVARRAHMDEISARINKSESVQLNRLVTWNLDQHLLALDMLRDCRQPAFLERFYQRLRGLTVLDPTSGSGVFLCAALAQLEPLYLACLTRMEQLLATPSANNLTPKQIRSFHTYLEEAGNPEQRPFTIQHWIVEHNLYGVDLMVEAVEICRQRLFCKVLAALPAQQSMPPLDSFGQHIRAGNSLLGPLHATDREAPDTQQQAFAWHKDFPAVIDRGGFDAVIGNPPYVEYGRVRQLYTVDGYATLETGNLYALTIERSTHLLAPGGRFGMVVPASATCTDGYRALQRQLLAQQELHIASFSDQRGRLFNIPHPRLCIILYEKAAPDETRPCQVFTTPYLKLERARDASLFERLRYTEVTDQVRPGIIPRYGSPLEHTIATKLTLQPHCLGDYQNPAGQHPLYFTRKLSWFVQVTPFIPLILDEQGQTRAPSELKILRFTSPIHAQIAFLALNSNLFYWFITTRSDCRNLNSREVLGLPLDLARIAPELLQELCQLSGSLEQDLQANSQMKPMVFQNKGRLTIQCMYPARSKHLIDEIDRVLARHYDLSDAELDFLLHYDSKYRLPGKVAEKMSV